MLTPTDTVEILAAPEVRSFFIRIIESELSSEAKYAVFVSFFREREDIKSQLIRNPDAMLSAKNPMDVAKLVSRAGQDIGSWNPDKFKGLLLDSIRRALWRIKASRSGDHGWGPDWNHSDVWGTAFAILCLRAAEDAHLDVALDLRELIEGGVRWLQDRPSFWAPIALGEHGELAVYRVALAIKCLLGAGMQLQESTEEHIKTGLRALVAAQNGDHGWDAGLWGASVAPVRVWSEAGATGIAVQAFCSIGHPAYLDVVEKAAAWLVASQNKDGSWNGGSCRPELPKWTVTGVSAINKTCDALNALLSLGKLKLPLDPYRRSIDDATRWLQRQQRPILGNGNQIMGWGWYRDKDQDQSHAADTFELQNTSMTLETLIQADNPPLPLLVSSINWLISQQERRDGDVMDGAWTNGHTARIALAMIGYHRRFSEAGF